MNRYALSLVPALMTACLATGSRADQPNRDVNVVNTPLDVHVVNQPKADGPYQESVASTCNGGNCRFNLSTVPVGTRRVIRNVSCVVKVNSTFSKITFAVLSNDIQNVSQYMVATPVYPDPTFGYFNGGGVFNAATLMFFEAGQVPKIGFDTFDWSFQFTCMVSGHDQKL